MSPARFALSVNIAVPAALIGDPGRAAMLMLLMDGSRRTAGELAAGANLSPQSASGHLTRLRDGGLLKSQIEGRRRFYSLAGPHVGRAIENLLALAPKVPERNIRESMRALREARTCYDHLAGLFGVNLHDIFLRRGLIRPAANDMYAITPAGDSWLLENFAINHGTLKKGRRAVARACIDWTERCPHLGGALGAALLVTFMGRKWFRPIRPHRALEMTSEGKDAFARLGLDLAFAKATPDGTPRSARALAS